MVTISSIQIELELRELRRELLCRDLIKYLSSGEEHEPDTEKYDDLLSTDNQYKYDEQDYSKFKEIHRFKCL